MVNFDPRDFIFEPFVECPQCKKIAFGVVTIGRDSYHRRCKSCLFPAYGQRAPEGGKLPRLRKKIIYLDQLALSLMLKASDETIPRRSQTADLSRWKSLYERLQRLVRLQLIVCPSSVAHDDESMVTTYFQPLRMLYEGLGNGASFYDFETIHRFQLVAFAEAWIRGRKGTGSKYDTQSICHGELHGWTGRFTIVAHMDNIADLVKELTDARNATETAFVELFEGWQRDKDKDYAFWFQREASAFGPVYLRGYVDYFNKILRIQSGDKSVGSLDLLPGPAISLVHNLQEVFKKAGIAEDQTLQKAFELLQSEAMQNVPFNRISSSLYAMMAHKAGRGGRRKPPTRGVVKDVQVISTLLPYCDAMFLDNECAGLLRERPLADEVKGMGLTFSAKSFTEFVKYLESIESGASKSHFDKVREVYGERWMQ